MDKIEIVKLCGKGNIWIEMELQRIVKNGVIKFLGKILSKFNAKKEFRDSNLLKIKWPPYPGIHIRISIPNPVINEIS